MTRPESAAAAHWWADYIATHHQHRAPWYTRDQLAAFQAALAAEIDAHVALVGGRPHWGVAGDLRTRPGDHPVIAAAAQVAGIKVVRDVAPPDGHGVLVSEGLVTSRGRGWPERVVYGPLAEWVRSRLEEDEETARGAAEELSYQSEGPELGSGPALSVGDAAAWGVRAPRVLGWPQRQEAVCEVAGEDAVVVAGRCGGHVARFDPARVLADVAAKQKVVGAYEAVVIVAGRGADDPVERARLEGRVEGLRVAVEALASGYRGCPGFREEWSGVREME